MKYQVNGKGDNNKNYSTIINAKSAQQAKQLATGNLLKHVTSVISLDKENMPVKAWEVINDKLERTL